MARKTYKLIKETPTVKKGAIYQEACDDGTQEYIILDQGFIKDVDGRGQVPIHTRSLVEEAPQWFVEVFQVEPQFMTAIELERWEAFKVTRTIETSPRVVALKAEVGPAIVAPNRQAISPARLAKFVSVYNSSRTTKIVAAKLNVSVGTVYVYKSQAQRNGIALKSMKRSWHRT